MTVYATALAAGETLTPAQRIQAAQGHDTSAYLVALAETFQNGLATINALADLQDVRNFDVRNDISWPTPA